MSSPMKTKRTITVCIITCYLNVGGAVFFIPIDSKDKGSPPEQICLAYRKTL